MVYTPPVPDEVTIQAAAEAAGQRLDRYLASLDAADDDEGLVGSLSRARIQKLISAGDVTVDGTTRRPAHRLRGGESIGVRVPPPEPLDLVPEPMDLDVLYEDVHLIAVAKPAGLVVHPGAGHRAGTLVHGLLAHCNDLSGIGGVERPGIVHRLDRGTSGIVVVAKTDQAHVGLAAAFSQRQVDKQYRAFVLGEPTAPRATIDTCYARHPTQRVKFTSQAPTGKRAVTDYEVVAAHGGISELKIRLHTGRTHQIRVHLSDLGHPVVGDPLYGGRQWRRIEAWLRPAAQALDHQALHAERVRLAHPVTGKLLELEAALPPPLAALRR
jgi:23S rRNA pseudouridine1911/1915/1917 synthase